MSSIDLVAFFLEFHQQLHYPFYRCGRFYFSRPGTGHVLIVVLHLASYMSPTILVILKFANIEWRKWSSYRKSLLRQSLLSLDQSLGIRVRYFHRRLVRAALVNQ